MTARLRSTSASIFKKCDDGHERANRPETRRVGIRLGIRHSKHVCLAAGDPSR